MTDDSGELEDKEHFEQLIDRYEREQPRLGQILLGEILVIDENGVILDVGAKQDAIVPGRDLTNVPSALIEGLSVGDQIHVYVTETPGYGGKLVGSLEKGLMHADWVRAEGLLESQETQDLTITGHNKGGLLVKFGSLEGFIPNSLAGHARSNGADGREALLGQPISAKVIEVEPQNQRLILSAKAAQKDQRLAQLQTFEIGDKVEGTVANIVDFGIFVNLGAVDGLVHTSELSWKTVDHPSKLFSPGERITVQVIRVDEKRGRISLSTKALMPNPWETVNDDYAAGDLIEGAITSIQDFGAFVRLDSGIEGLIHLSEMDGPPEMMDQALEIGGKVLVRITEIDQVQQRISLSLRKVTEEEEMAWMQDPESIMENAPGQPESQS